MSLNKVTLSGNLGADAELRYTKGGNPVVSFSLAVNDVDPARGAPRHGLTLFGGIVDDKEPKRFGPAWLRPPLSPSPPTLTSP